MSAQQIKPFDCLLCGHYISAMSGAGHDRQPKPGDVSACVHCGAVMIWGGRGELRAFTEAEAEELARDERAMATLRRVVGAIRIVQAGKN
jgi:hypothetical protein